MVEYELTGHAVHLLQLPSKPALHLQSEISSLAGREYEFTSGQRLQSSMLAFPVSLL
jgi:hypothetical protein